MSKKTGWSRNCQFCGKEFYLSEGRSKRGRGKFCSFECYWLNMKGRKLPRKTKDKMSVSAKRLEKPNSWKGGKRHDSRGYVSIYMPNHPFAYSNKRYVREHRLVMQKHLGRFLQRKEVVHHIDSNPKNNNINNLMLFSSNIEHRKFEMAMKKAKIQEVCHS